MYAFVGMGSFIDDLTVHCILGFQIRNRLPRPVSRSHIRAAIDILHGLQFCLKALENEMLILRYDLWEFCAILLVSHHLATWRGLKLTG